MFRQAAAGPFDDVVAKATDENLTAEDWGAIMEVCDRVASDTNGSKEAVQSMIKRLAHRNANVQLYTLELANALSQNCDKSMHRELASRAFTDALLRLANDRTTHTQVKSKVLERMKEWSDMFKTDADLGIMYDAYTRLKQANPALQPPSAPQKNSLTDQDRQKEEDELQMALKLSLQEEERKKTAAAGGKGKAVAGPSGEGPAASASGATDQQGAAQLSNPVPVPAGTTAATVSRVRALYDFQPAEPSELEFKKGDVIAVLESVYKDWWRGSLKGKTGIFPLNYVEKLSDPTPEELQREAQMEAEVFAEIKNVEKLLTLLSAGGPGGSGGAKEEDNEEIGKLYHQTLAIRPKLIKLIEKYSQKKDDFTQLNEKFIKARRDYEALLESSMSHPPQPVYHQYGMRPGPGPGAGVPPPSGPSHGHQHQHSYSGPSNYPPPQQEPQRFYTPGPPQEQSQYPQPSPSPNFHRPAQSTPAPFYIAGTEVPSHGGPPPASSIGYPPRDNGGRVPSGSKQPAPINTSPPTGQSSTPFNGGYSQPPNHQQSQPQQGQQGHGGPRPQSTYGAQELATSAYDSPVMQQGQNPNGGNHNPQSAATYSSSVYSQDDYNASPIIGTSTIANPQQPSYAPPALGAYGQVDNSIPNVLTPPPLQPSGSAYDGRQGLPSQQPQQFKPYVPSSGSEIQNAQVPADYYRQSGVY